MIAPWGGVVWLLTLSAQIYVAAMKPRFFVGGGFRNWLDGVLLALYLFLSWRANVRIGDGRRDRLFDRIIAHLRALAQGKRRPAVEQIST